MSRASAKHRRDAAAFPQRPGPAEPVDYDELPGYLGYLVRRTHSRIQTEFETSLSTIGITTTAFGILTLIRANPGITAMALVVASSLDKSTLSPIIFSLESAGFIRREPRATDRRVQSLYFVDQAEPRFQDFRHRIRAFEKSVSSRLTPTEQGELARLLMKLQGFGESTRPPLPPSPQGATRI